MQKAPPKALGADPIVEATFEVRFGATHPSVGDLLPGMLFPRLRNQFGKLQALPLSQVPRVLRAQDQTLAYQATSALIGPGKRLALGERVATLSFPRPYPGWSQVRQIIQDVLEALAATDLIASVDRISLKYVNVLTVGKSATDLSMLRLSLELAAFEPKPAGRMIRAEVEHRGCIHIIQVITGAELTITIPDEKPQSLSGVMVDVDTIRMGPFQDPWRQIPALVDEVHAAEKDVFFGLLTDDAIAKMRPIYG